MFYITLTISENLDGKVRTVNLYGIASVKLKKKKRLS